MKNLFEWLRAHLQRLLDVPSRGSVNIGDQATLELLVSQGKMINGRITALDAKVFNEITALYNRLNVLEDHVSGLQSMENMAGEMATATTKAVSDMLTEMEKFKALVKLTADGMTLSGDAERLIADVENVAGRVATEATESLLEHFVESFEKRIAEVVGDPYRTQPLPHDWQPEIDDEQDYQGGGNS